MARLLFLVLTLITLFALSSCDLNYKSYDEPDSETTTTTTTEKPPMTITTKENYTHNIYRLNISAVCLENNSVGNEWYSDFSISDEKIYNGQKISVPNDIKKLIIDTEIRENDKADDISKKAITLNLANFEPTKAQIIVTENGGAYKGNTALWEITVSAELIERI